MFDTSSYRELYHYDDKHSLVRDEISGDVLVMKRLVHYDREVYAYLADHPDRHIPQIIGIQETDGVLIVVEEFVQGNTFDVIIQDKNLSDKAKLAYFEDLCEGLRFLHSAPKPIIHRDLKPSNIMVTKEGRVVIIDHDAAKTFKPQNSQDTACLGTEGRAAPEQYGFMQSDARTDIYAVGRMLRDAFPKNPRIQKIAARAMRFDPKDRYDSVDALLNVLRRRVRANSKLNPIFPPPGFRTKTWWKVILAIISYPFIFFLIVGLTVENGDITELIIDKVLFTLYAFISIDLCFSWTGMFDGLPFVSDRRWILRVVFKLIFLFVMFIAMLILTVILVGLVRNITAWL